MDNMQIPASVSTNREEEYLQNYNKITKGTDHLFLFAGDQKAEHLNDDFVGEGIDPSDANPEHLFDIASKSPIGAFATQFGLISRYAKSYPNVNYIVKMNSRTPLVKKEQDEPISTAIIDIDDVIRMKHDHKLSICGIGYTIYIGSEFEYEMLAEAGRLVARAHSEGLVATIWAYPRGKAVTDERNGHLIAGAAGLGAVLGADFVKVNLPTSEQNPVESLKEAVQAAGRTKVITAGGENKPAIELIKEVYAIHQAGVAGNAIGRNIHQRSTDEAVRITKAISAIVYENKSEEEALRIIAGE